MATFLLVDDDPRIHEYLTMLLAPYASMDLASNGMEAMEKFKSSLSPDGSGYDAVFMDILMPDMDGHHTVQKLRELEDEAGVPDDKAFRLVMVTALADTDNVSKAFFKGYASCYVTKPFEKERVIEELKVAGII